MSDLKIEIKGLDEMARKFKERGKEIEPMITRVISKVALLVERFGKIYSPVKTGLMRASIYPVNISTLQVNVGPKVEYAKYVHARVPFMFAARQDVLPSVDEILKSEARKALN